MDLEYAEVILKYTSTLEKKVQNGSISPEDYFRLSSKLKEWAAVYYEQ